MPMKTKPAIGAKQTAQKPRVMYAEHTLRRPLESTNTLRFTDVGAHDHCIPVAVIPCQSLKQARQRVKFERMGWEEKVEAVALALYNHSNRGTRNMHGTPYHPYSMKKWMLAWKGDEQRKDAYWLSKARAVLLALGHAPEGGMRK